MHSLNAREALATEPVLSIPGRAPSTLTRASAAPLEVEHHMDAQELVEWTYRRHRRVALVSSFQAESGVLIDMACRATASPEVLTIDTGRLPEETHELINEFQRRYLIRVRVLLPEPDEVATLTAQHGTMPFRESVELRHRCCDIRKVRPLARVLGQYDAWITGVRREQMPSRAATPFVAEDAAHGGIAKVAPLAAWTRDQVWHYLEKHSVPHNTLYDRGYTSIGCSPCTRATQTGEDERAGRWWWELDAAKECGLHALPLTERSGA